MALFESGNPTLSEKIFKGTSIDASGELMTVRGTVNKFGFLMLMVIGGASFTWSRYYDQVLIETAASSVMPFLLIGLFGGLISGIAIRIKPTWAPYLSPLYGIMQGFVLGGLSAIVNDRFKENYPGIVMQAVGLTFAVALSMFVLYRFRIIKVTEKLRSVIYSAVIGVAVFYLITFVLQMFKLNVSFMYDSSALGIGISLFVIVIAAFKLLLDFDLIERGAEEGAPKFMEWYGAFGLLVTLIWLYMEILKLLMRFAGRRD